MMSAATFSEEYPDLAAQWHPTKNTHLPQPTRGMTAAAWWQCDQGHEWQAPPYSRVKGNNCPVCANRRILPGFNDLATTHPRIAAEWHPTRNTTLTPDLIHAGNTQPVWWLSPCGHTWRITAKARTQRNTACTICSGKHILPGFNDLATLHPNIAAQWHPTRNDTRTPETSSPYAHTETWWEDHNHTWKARISSRTSHNQGCPYCAGKQVLPGFNDLATQRPDIAAQWHPTKNPTLTPEHVTVGSSKKVWWSGACNHEWPASIYSMTKQSASSGCPYCAGKQVLPGFNDLATLHPNIAAQWHPTRNLTNPSEITSKSHTKYWWQCAQKHLWKATAASRTNMNSGCPTCAAEKTTSKGEDAVAAYIQSLGHTIQRSIQITHPSTRTQVDIYIPELRIGIEYNGLYWHSTQHRPDPSYHHQKWRTAAHAGIHLIQIWEDDWNTPATQKTIKETLSTITKIRHLTLSHQPQEAFITSRNWVAEHTTEHTAEVPNCSGASIIYETAGWEQQSTQPPKRWNIIRKQRVIPDSPNIDDKGRHIWDAGSQIFSHPASMNTSP